MKNLTFTKKKYFVLTIADLILTIYVINLNSKLEKQRLENTIHSLKQIRKPMEMYLADNNYYLPVSGENITEKDLKIYLGKYDNITGLLSVFYKKQIDIQTSKEFFTITAKALDKKHTLLTLKGFEVETP